MSKKTCLALAALACIAGAAHAQSSVTIYGVIDQGIRHMDDGQSTLTFFPQALIGNKDTWTMGPAYSSRLGFRGSEDLGNGLKANFLIEHRFLPDTGAVEPRDGGFSAFWNAASYVGLSGSFGEVRLGRQYVPAFFVAIAADPWAYDYNVAGGAAFTRGGNGVTTAYNAVTYWTPNLNGFSAQVMVAAGEGGGAVVNPPAINPADPTQGTRKGHNVGMNVQYNAGPLYAGIAYNDFENLGPTDRENKYWTLTVAYDFGVVRPIIGISQGQNNVANSPKTKTMLLGATAPLGNGKLKAVVARYDAAVGQNFNAANSANLPTLTNGQNTTKFGLGYEYFFSKRTSVHADIGTAKTETVSRTTGYEFGLKHAF